MKRSVFYISDGTAITAEVLGHAVLSQFPLEPDFYTIPFVDNVSKATEVCQKINDIYLQSGSKPLVFFSIVSEPVREIILTSHGFCQDVVQSLIAPLQQELGIEPIASSQRRPYGLTENNMLKYDARIAAIDYTLAHDDGISLRNLELAQVISKTDITPRVDFFGKLEAELISTTDPDFKFHSGAPVTLPFSPFQTHQQA